MLPRLIILPFTYSQCNEDKKEKEAEKNEKDKLLPTQKVTQNTIKIFYLELSKGRIIYKVQLHLKIHNWHMQIFSQFTLQLLASVYYLIH